MIETLQSWADDRGYQVAWGPAEVLRRARVELSQRRASGDLDMDFCRDHLEFLFEGDDAGGDETVVVVAIPRPAHRVGFDLGTKRVDALLPPTYLRYRATFEEVRRDLAENGLPGARVEHLTAPLKTLASKLGLVRYGRNNIAYARGIGSYLQLCAYLTDAPLQNSENPAAQMPELLPECDDCTRCRSACPTNAINDDRVLLSAERCITAANENPGPLPDSIPRRSHHCLVGCMRCQLACPANPKLPVEDSGICFSATETDTLIEGRLATGGQAETGVRIKLAALGQPGLEPVLGRNLRALLDGRDSGAAQKIPGTRSPRVDSRPNPVGRPG